MPAQVPLPPLSKGAWLIAVVAVMLCSSGFWGPYVFHLVTSPWAWTGVNENSLTGTWVGTLTLVDDSPGGPSFRPNEMGVLIEMRLQVFAWVAHLTGTVKTCREGVIAEQPFSYGAVEMGTIDGDSVKLHHMEGTGYSTIDGMRNGNDFAIKVNFTQASASGILHKGTEADFVALCKQSER